MPWPPMWSNPREAGTLLQRRARRMATMSAAEAATIKATKAG